MAKKVFVSRVKWDVRDDLLSIVAAQIFLVKGREAYLEYILNSNRVRGDSG